MNVLEELGKQGAKVFYGEEKEQDTLEVIKNYKKSSGAKSESASPLQKNEKLGKTTSTQTWLSGAKPLDIKKPFLKQMQKFPVYLILPNEDTTHTSINRFNIKDEWYYLLDFNKKIYNAKEIEQGKGELNKQACNFLFLENDELIRGEGEFTKEANAQITDVDRMKLEDRSFEKSSFRMKKKYAKASGINVIVGFLIVCVGVFLVLWVLLSGLPQVITAMNAAAQIAVQAIPPEPLANQSFIVQG